jgi:hypothetical protein
MKTSFLFLLFLSGFCVAGPEVNKKYSYKDFTSSVLTDVKPDDLNDSIIVGSCFASEGVNNRVIFPKDMKGVIFRRCNLDNIYVDEDKNTIEKDCSHEQIMIQNDLEDWKLDKDLKPKEPVDKQSFLDMQLSIDPKDIPKTKMTESLTTKTKKDNQK